MEEEEKGNNRKEGEEGEEGVCCGIVGAVREGKGTRRGRDK